VSTEFGLGDTGGEWGGVPVHAHARGTRASRWFGPCGTSSAIAFECGRTFGRGGINAMEGRGAVSAAYD